MADYSFVTIWRFESLIQPVWDAIQDAANWSKWWKGVSGSQLEPGDASGIGARWRFRFKSRLPYTLEFESRTTRVEQPSILEGESTGELVGMGRWTLSEAAGITTVRYDWNVRATRPWMERLAPVARPFFEWNHDAIMSDGGEGLARYLGARLLESSHARGHERIKD